MTFPKLALSAVLSADLAAPLASVARAQDARKKESVMKGGAMQKNQTAQSFPPGR